MSKSRGFYGTLVMILLAICIGGALLSGSIGLGKPTEAAEIGADIVRSCAEEQDREKCYERMVPVLYPKYDVQEVFGVIAMVRQLDPTYQFCHVLAHGLGERVVAEDPAKWIDAIPLNPPNGMCSNGFIHGVVSGKFRAEVLDEATIDSLISDFSRACEARPAWHPSDLDRAICYHGLGHLYTHITDADLPTALNICARTTGEQFSRVCIEGVFMQIYQPLEPDDFALIERMPVKPTKETVRTFCAAYTQPEFVGACLRESWPFFDDEIRSGDGVATFCAGQPNKEEELKCFESATAIIGRMTLGDPEGAATACNRLPDERRLTCFVTVSRAIIEENRDSVEESISLCQMAPLEVATACARTLAEQASFVYGQDTTRKQRFCDAVPFEYRNLCR